MTSPCLAGHGDCGHGRSSATATTSDHCRGALLKMVSRYYTVALSPSRKDVLTESIAAEDCPLPPAQDASNKAG
ncbi:hypothetical protein E2562_006919 [Oryza meyeriana var. granulata]|uniref:Uncharacterized protein n=1 Tax=Oryza meyeriana var. granulata TaxID=110450 RepID=A0A6G1BKR1_9ORYZ|nr:hypothetical protein E2562_006919 [Oryza meyeriana var. granulata]